MLRVVVVCALFLGGPGLRAAEELPVDALVTRARAIAVVDVTLGADADEAAVSSWIASSTQTVAPFSSWSRLCAPDRATLVKWAASLPTHPGRPWWTRALDDGRYTTVLFFTEKDGALTATCEGEAMRARQWTMHDEHAAFRSELDRALAATSAPGPGSTTSAPPAPSSSPADPAPSTMPTGAGCL